MKFAIQSMLGLALVFALVAGASAEDKTYKGKITCAKCDLKKEAKCATVVVVSEKGKDVLYYFDKASNSKYHGDTCKEAKEGTVTGTVSEKDGKKYLKVAKVEYKE